MPNESHHQGIADNFFKFRLDLVLICARPESPFYFGYNLRDKQVNFECSFAEQGPLYKGKKVQILVIIRRFLTIFAFVGQSSKKCSLQVVSLKRRLSLIFIPQNAF